jgi:hypothetical protein
MRFHGKVGYGTTVESETSPGVWEDVITERDAYGDVIRASRAQTEGESVNQNLTVGNSISIVADAFASENYMEMRYVTWQGVRWSVTDVAVERPRLVLTLGEVFNGPLPTPESP